MSEEKKTESTGVDEDRGFFLAGDDDLDSSGIPSDDPTMVEARRWLDMTPEEAEAEAVSVGLK